MKRDPMAGCPCLVRSVCPLTNPDSCEDLKAYEECDLLYQWAVEGRQFLPILSFKSNNEKPTIPVAANYTQNWRNTQRESQKRVKEKQVLTPQQKAQRRINSRKWYWEHKRR